MFVLKSTPLKKSLRHVTLIYHLTLKLILQCAYHSLSALGPGAAKLVEVLSNPELPADQRVNCAKVSRELTTAEWALVVKAFDEWPFAPEVGENLIHQQPAINFYDTGPIHIRRSLQ